ncbi:hypothetical protein ABZ960_35935 [Streptomyces pseudovenezuelae]|uniref:hypothetical protein n=1 Tax=Streptomyces pseudovenezuelae TaxID=67350 RepID=UPI0034A1D4BA
MSEGDTAMGVKGKVALGPVVGVAVIAVAPANARDDGDDGTSDNTGSAGTSDGTGKGSSAG